LRYDKYQPEVGNHRAALAAAWVAANVNRAFGVGLDTNGKVVVGAGNTGIIGIVILSKAKPAGTTVDIMKFGECVEADVYGPTNTASGFTAGTKVYADNVTGALSLVATGATLVGHTAEASRLIVSITG
jgi:hypothetical protein